MHELSIAMSILDVAEEQLENRPEATVQAIYVRLGPLSGVVKESLQSAYELAREQTRFAQTRLVLEDCPIVVFCETCKAERPVHSWQRMCCAQCDTPASKVVRGRELELAALELTEGEPEE